MNGKKYKQLVITPSYVPVDSSVTLINAKIIKLLELKGIETIVLTVAKEDTAYYINDKLLDIFSSVRKVYRIKSYEKGGSLLIATRRFLRKIFPIIFYIPDFHFVWEVLAIARLKKIALENDINFIHSISAPYCSHIVGYFAKLIIKKPWVCHLDDFWADQPVEHFDRYRSINCWLERKCFEKADVVLSTSREILDMAGRRYPENVRKKFVFIPPCYNLSDYPENYPTDCKHYTFTFMGVFYKNRREPAGLFEALKVIKKKHHDIYGKLRIRLIGRNAGEWKSYIGQHGLSDVVELKDQVDYLESLAEMKKAAVLMHIGFMRGLGEEDIHVSGKIFEYFGAQRMILGITTPTGPVADMIRKAKGLTANYHEPDDIARTIITIINEYPIDKLYGWKNPPDIEGYSSEAFIAKYETIFERLNN